MDLPCPEWVRHVEQKWTDLRSEGTEGFCLLTDIDAIFSHGLSILGSVIYCTQELFIKSLILLYVAALVCI